MCSTNSTFFQEKEKKIFVREQPDYILADLLPGGLKPCFHGYDLKPSRSRSVGDHLLANSLKSIENGKIFTVGEVEQIYFSAAKYDERK